MFYSTFVLQKKGPFAKVWIAAHWDKKLTKTDIKLIDISETVVNIVRPTVPIALRTSGELMLGVVKIYRHKVIYLLKEAQDATVKIKALDIIQPGKIDMPQAKGAVVAVIEPEHAAEVDETLPIYENPFLLPDRSFMDGAPPRIGAHLGELDDWFQAPAEGEPTFEESQQEAFFPSLSQPFGPPAQEKTPSEVSSVVSSTERLRERVTPDRRREPDITVEVPVDELDLFAKLEAPPLEEAPLPEPLEMVTPAKPAEEMEAVPELPPPEKVERPKKRAPVVVDKQVTIPTALMRGYLSVTSDILQQEGRTPLDQRGMEMRTWDNTPLVDRFAMPVSCRDIASVLNDVWMRCVQAPSAEELAETEELRRLEGRPSFAPGEFPIEPEMVPPGAPYEMMEEPQLPGPAVEMALPETPLADRKRKAAEEAEARKRARVEGPDLARTVHETLAQLVGQFKTKASVKFGVLVKSQPRSVVATRFYDVLVLKNKNMVDVKQQAPLAEIIITPTEHFKEELAQA